ncbi:MAG: PKD domain-containing protein [Gammaproteobacteria bacterium]|nr:PKD domain-containing protein [Gammaproteobacteria bacterium]
MNSIRMLRWVAFGAASLACITALAGDGGHNTRPVADAGASQTVMRGETVVLDGSGSYDADGDSLTYHWTLETPPGSNAQLSDPNVVMPTFVADIAGTYEATLVVNDGHIDSFPCTIKIVTEHGNTPPVANAGPDQSVVAGSTVQLNGSGTDVDGDQLTFLWTVTAPDGSGVTLSDPTIVNPTFVADLLGDYVATLVANDGQADSAPDSATITTMDNSPPIADAGDPQSVAPGDNVVLDGSGSSDPDGDLITYAWTLTSIPGNSAAMLVNANTVNPNFVADVSGTYVVQLIVNDSLEDSVPDTVTIMAGANAPPLADAGPDDGALVGVAYTLDGSGSSDPDGDDLTYEWSLIVRPDTSTATIDNPTLEMPTFTPDVAGTYVAQLIVNDGTVDSAPDTANITAALPATVSIGDAEMPLTESTIQFEVTLEGAVPGGVTVQYRVVIPALLSEFFSMSGGAVTFTGNGPIEVQLTGAGALFNAAVRPSTDLAFCVFIGDADAPVVIGDELGVGIVRGNTPAVIPDDICDGVVNPLTGTVANAASSLSSGDNASTASGIGAIGLLCLVTVAIRRRRFTV